MTDSLATAEVAKDHPFLHREGRESPTGLSAQRDIYTKLSRSSCAFSSYAPLLSADPQPCVNDF